MQHQNDAFANQRKVSKLYRERLLAIIDRQLTHRFGNDGENYQIAKLEVDLGVVHWSEIATVFEQKLAEALCMVSTDKKGHEKVESARPEPTPFKVVSYYLRNGILPWWVKDRSHDQLRQQLDALLENPDYTFRELLSQVRFQDHQLDRFLNTFSDDQVCRSLQLLTPLSANDLLAGKKEIAGIVSQNKGRLASGLSPLRVAKAFWKEAFFHVGVTKTSEELKKRTLKRTLEQLGAHAADIVRWIGEVKEVDLGEVDRIQKLAEQLKKRHRDNSTWQRFFEHLLEVVHRPRFPFAEPSVLGVLKKRLMELESDQKDPFVSLINETKRKEQDVLKYLDVLEKRALSSSFKALIGRMLRLTVKEWNPQDLNDWKAEQNLPAAQKKEGAAFQVFLKKWEDLLAWEKTSLKRQQAATEGLLQPLARHLHRVSEDKAPPTRHPDPFDDADAISVGNAGLVILWPFLTRFFENLQFLEKKAFLDPYVMNKAVCALQYLVNEEEEDLFEADMPLNKVLCGVALGDPITPITFSDPEKEIAVGLLQAVIAQGPHWKNLTMDGLRSSYLRREGLLKSRDGNWLLQVKKETYDITLEKLPWSFQVVKLPWMNQVLMVEWV